VKHVKLQSEAKIERRLVAKVQAAGGLCLKWTGAVGVPDRIVALPHGKLVFVEVKAAGGRLSAMQELMHKKMKAVGVQVEVVWSDKDVDQLIERLTKI
jgi:hypothetical protein